MLPLKAAGSPCTIRKHSTAIRWKVKVVVAWELAIAVMRMD